MSNPTSNFGWVMPTNTDLVTDLPADFAVFGQAVDTSMADLKGGTTGQILSKATSADMDFTWIANDQGDITAVTTTAPLQGGGTSGAIALTVDAASTSASGVVQLSDSTSTTSSVLAATPTAVKSAYDLANGAIAKTTVTTAGDIIYRNATVPTRLGIGSTGQVLTVSGGAPSWATPAASASGLTLISSTSFTTSSAHSVNSCFSATYVNYRIILKLSAVSGTNTEMLVRLRASGTDATTNYTTMRQLSYSAGVSSDLNPTGTDDWTMGLISTTSPTGLHTASMDIFDPFAATPTQGTSILNGYYGGSYYLLICSDTNTNSTSYDGFSLIPATGTITGTVRVYGYQNS